MDAAHIACERQAIVAEAMTWRGTPYHPNARVKGHGADCLTFVAGVFETLLGPINVPYYPPDWHLNQRQEWYSEGIRTWGGVEVESPPSPGSTGRAPLPGDIVLFKFGHDGCPFSHGAIVVDWPVVIQSYSMRKIGTQNVLQSSTLCRYFENGPSKGKPRPRKFFTLKRWVET